MIGICIIAPNTAARVGLRALLADEPHLQVIAESASVTGLKELKTEPDVLVYAPTSSMELAALLQELQNLQWSEKVAVLIIHDDPALLEALKRAELFAWGLLPEELTPAELIAAVMALNEGLAVSSPRWLNQPQPGIASPAGESSTLVEPLSTRETEILQLLALGLTNKQIAARLGISAHTVKFHVSSIFGKMDTTNRTETVKLGLKIGLIMI